MAETDARWYVLHTYSGYEKKVQETVIKAAENRGMMKSENMPNPDNELIYSVSVPVETVTEIVDSKRKESEHLLYPGYVLIKMVLTDESWHLVRNVRGVTGFVGSANKAIPLTEAEIESMGIERREVVVGFEVGSRVKVMDGTLAGYEGTVDGIEVEKSRARIIVNMFGRETMVDIDIEQIGAI